jgi:polysaccharide pyruvyl transferase WcaK-like protein
MHAVSTRDEPGRVLAEALTSKPVSLVPDPALLLSSAPPHEADALLTSAGLSSAAYPLIGVAVRRSFHQYPSLIPHKYATRFKLRRIPGQESCDRMITLLAAVLDRVSSREQATVLCLPTYNAPHEADDQICLRVMEKMRTERKALIRVRDPRLYKGVATRLSVMLGGRMHPTILSASVGTPIVGLSYNQKFRGFFDLIGRGDKVIDVQDFVSQELTHQLETLLTKAIREGSNTPPSLSSLGEKTRKFITRVTSEASSEKPAPTPRPGTAKGA